MNKLQRYFSAIFLFNVALVSSHSTYNKIDLRSNPKNAMTETEVTTPFRLQKDNSNHNGKLHYRTKNDEVTRELLDQEFNDPKYKIVAFGRETIIELTQDNDLLAPAFTTTASFENATSVPQSSPSILGCYYKGKVVGQPASEVSLSICGGLLGSIYSEDEELFIEPTKRGNGEQVEHVIHRRSLRRKTRSPRSKACGVNDHHHQGRYTMTFMNGVDQFSKLLRSKRSATEVNSGLSSLGEQGEPVLSRKKRGFQSRQHYIETLVVADTSMIHHHRDDLEHYILTIMMVANRVFSHPSLGNAIQINVVKIIRAGDDLRISSNAQRTLRDFCEWQSKKNTPDDTHPDHYDLAVLLTRRDLCGADCDTLGMADVGAMCSNKHSCAIVEDDGLSTAYTVAHEIGHVLNMMHDDNVLCRDRFGSVNPNTHIMSAMMNHVDTDEPWSVCSREAITSFLSSDQASCMHDRPRRAKAYPTELPGEMYDVNAQCEMAFGPGAVECPFMQECARLWCHTPGGAHQCHTRHFPRADGTSCGVGLNCFQGSCVAVSKSTRIPREGHWGQWGSFGSCSRSCDGGIQMSSRECNNPAPENGGKYCTGARLRFKSCNTQKCPTKRNSRGRFTDFRGEQCAVYNGKSFPHLGVNVASTWVPKYTDIRGNDRCKLTCQSVQTGVYVILGSKVIDGTRCSPDTNDVCVQGICMKAGCDGVLGSKAKLDRCGVCGGSNRHCKRYKGVYKKRRYGYNDVVKIPAGAASVQILQRGYRNKVADGNYLAIKDWTGTYLLNGGYTLSTYQKDISVNETVIRYSGVGSATEKIQITGKLSGELQIQVLTLGIGSKARILPPRIKYVYYRVKSPRKTKPPKKVTKPSKPRVPSGKLSWVTGRLSECKPRSGTCGAGLRTRQVICKDSKGYIVAGCESRVKPYDQIACMKPCTTPAVRTNPQSNPRRPSGGITVNREGQDSSGPHLVSRNGGQPTWVEGRWGPCSRSCGRGDKFRMVKCRNRSGQLFHDSECAGVKPLTRHGCKLRECP